MKKALLILAVAVVYVLHQDVWFWRTARPLVFGFLPVGLAYHAFFSFLAAGLMWLLVRFAWPSDLEAQAESHGALVSADAAVVGGVGGVAPRLQASHGSAGRGRE